MISTVTSTMASTAVRTVLVTAGRLGPASAPVRRSSGLGWEYAVVVVVAVALVGYLLWALLRPEKL